MLSHLSIRDFVIVAALEMDFENGFTVFSGETGAGKSILLDALSLLLGARADAAMVREGQPRADISAQWDISAQVQNWLTQHDLAIEEDTESPSASEGSAQHFTVLLRRVIESNGRSRAFINAIPVTLQQLRELGEQLVNLHAQHAHQQILRAPAQRTIFDLQSGLEELTTEVAHAWQRWRDAVEAVLAAHQQAQKIEEAQEALMWRLTELEKLAPAQGEWEALSAKQRMLSQGVKLVQGAHEALSTLSDDEEGVITRVGSILSAVSYLAELDPRLADILTALEPAEIGLQEAAHSLLHYTQTFDVHPDEVSEVEARLDAFFTVARKLRIAPEAVFDEHIDIHERLTALEAAADTSALLAAQRQAKEYYQDCATRLSQARAAAAPIFSEAVTAHMQTLSMAGGRFEVALIPLTQEERPDAPKRLDNLAQVDAGGAEEDSVQEASDASHSQYDLQGSAHGNERIEFRLTSHEDGALRPVAQVASGGELARIALALAVVSSATNAMPTLIFDEVDSGVGGAAAEAVGKLLRTLAKAHQVLCVTHLPQVAAHAQHHFCVNKTIDSKGRTISCIAPLEFDARVEEMARMLGGANLTIKTREHAKEMLIAAAQQ